MLADPSITSFTTFRTRQVDSTSWGCWGSSSGSLSYQIFFYNVVILFRPSQIHIIPKDCCSFFCLSLLVPFQILLLLTSCVHVTKNFIGSFFSERSSYISIAHNRPITNSLQVSTERFIYFSYFHKLLQTFRVSHKELIALRSVYDLQFRARIGFPKKIPDREHPGFLITHPRSETFSVCDILCLRYSLRNTPV